MVSETEKKKKKELGLEVAERKADGRSQLC